MGRQGRETVGAAGTVQEEPQQEQQDQTLTKAIIPLRCYPGEMGLKAMVRRL